MNAIHFFIWIAIALCCAVIELTAQATGRWFALGCGGFLAAISCFFVETPELQALVFVVSAAMCYVTVRVLAHRAHTPIVGMHVSVAQPMGPGVDGAVTVDGVLWSARCDTVVLAGAVVEVVRQEQNVLVVRPLAIGAK